MGRLREYMQGDRRPTRLLLPYASQQEAISHLASKLPPPEEEVARISDQWSQAVARLRSGEPRRLPDPEIGDVPAEHRAAADAVTDSAQFHLLLGNLSPRVVVARLDALIAIQKFVYSEQRDEPAVPDEADFAGLLQITLPEPQRQAIATVQDQTSSSYTFASDNPNLRIGGMAQAEVQAQAPNGAQLPLNVHGFFLTFGGPWVQVAHFNGRWFLRDGYHRAFHLLSRGVRRVPCIAVTANSLDDLGLIRPGFVGADVLLGDRPPLVGDLANAEIAVDGTLPRIHKVVRIRAEEFIVPADA